MARFAEETAPAPGQRSGAAGRPLKVMVVDDSAAMRRFLARWLAEEEQIELAASCADGREAIGKIAEIRPDVVLLDIEMPEMDGLTALPHLLKMHPPAKVLMVSALTRRNATATFRALARGAADCLAKPDSSDGPFGLDRFRRELVAKVRALGGGTAAARPAPAPDTAEADAPPRFRSFSVVVPQIVAIGSSTGGPAALVELMSALAPSFRHVPVVVVQHMPALFTEVLAERLGQAAGMAAKEAADGERLLPGTIYVAPGDRHMELKGREQARVAVSDAPPINFYRPSVDLLFTSASEIYGAGVLALVLTGMGSDGLKGAGAIADAGGSVLVQDQATSVVWGMPGAVCAAGLASGCGSVGQLAATAARLLRGERL